MNKHASASRTLIFGAIVILLALLGSIAYAVDYIAETTYDFTSTKPGPHFISATAYDEAGNSAAETITVEVDGTGTVETTAKLSASKSSIYLGTPNISTLLRANLYNGSKEMTASIVHIWAKPSAEETWTYQGQAYYAKTAGNYQWRGFPERTTDYQMRYNGNSYFAPSESPVYRVTAWTEVK